MSKSDWARTYEDGARDAAWWERGCGCLFGFLLGLAVGAAFGKSLMWAYLSFRK